ncbi:hypothetical protein [Brevibacillus laterosporus]|nr:hypothetical protein [Brevibacillus laterosporus]MDN9012349.1 hypothetical protein [Brevibacillus laterosporus]MDO0943464.1 hypothetical protein [Brevibacillus laterosporus]
MGIWTGKIVDRSREWIEKANNITPKTTKYNASAMKEKQYGTGGERNV